MTTENIKSKVCSHCGKELPIEQFSKTSTYTDGYQPFCKECEKKRKQRFAFMRVNLALERYPWPFNEKWHDMDVDEIEEDIERRRQMESQDVYIPPAAAVRVQHKRFEKVENLRLD